MSNTGYANYSSYLNFRNVTCDPSNNLLYPVKVCPNYKSYMKNKVACCINNCCELDCSNNCIT